MTVKPAPGVVQSQFSSTGERGVGVLAGSESLSDPTAPPQFPQPPPPTLDEASSI